MKTVLACALPAVAMFLAGCSDADDRADDRLEEAAEASAAIGGSNPVALNMTERELLDADLMDVAGVELGDVEGVLRNADGQVDRLLVEIEDSHPDKYVHVPIAGLKATQAGNTRAVTTTMTKQQLAALPAVPLATILKPSPSPPAPAP